MKTMKVADFLTDHQIEQCLALAREHGVTKCHEPIREEVIRPNLAEINKKLGQKNHPGYLAYMIQHCLVQAAAKSEQC